MRLYDHMNAAGYTTRLYTSTARYGCAWFIGLRWWTRTVDILDAPDDPDHFLEWHRFDLEIGLSYMTLHYFTHWKARNKFEA